MSGEDRDQTVKRAIKLPIGIAAVAGFGLAATGAQAADYTVENTADTGAGSLREAITDSNDQAGSDRILFQAGLTGTILLEDDLPEITGPIEIVGPGADLIAIDGDNQFHALTVTDSATISGLTIRRSANTSECYTYDYDGEEYTYCEYASGAALYAAGSQTTLAVDDMSFVDNQAAQAVGGAIGADDEIDLVVTDSTFSGNTAEYGGGAIFARGSIQLSGSTLTDSSSGSSGGAITVDGYGEASSISDSTFTGNTSEYAGGAIKVSGYGDVTIADSVFSENRASASGGALSFGYTPDEVTVSGSLFSGNESNVDGESGYSTYGGGAIFVGSSAEDMTIENSTLEGNEVEGGSGGAINIQTANVALDSLTVTDNSASVAGGGIYQQTQQSQVLNSIISGNTAGTGADLAGGPEGSGYYGDYSAGKLQAEFNLIGAAPGSVLIDSVPGSNLIGANPQLGPLADNGGATQTRLPATGSPVINQGSSSLTVDQRDLKRPVALKGIPRPNLPGANGADMGAVEVQGEEGPIDPPTGPTSPTGPTGPTTPTGPTGPTDSGKISFAGLKLNKKSGVATLSVKVPAAGQLLLAGSKTVVKQSKKASRAATIKLTVKAKGKAAKTLKKKGSVKVKAAVRFTPATGTVKSLSKNVKLIKKKPKSKKRR